MPSLLPRCVQLLLLLTPLRTSAPPSGDDALSSRAPKLWLPWKSACRAVRSLPNSTAHSRSERRLIGRIASAPLPVARAALHAGVARLRADLASRGVLCDHETPCEVTAHEDDGGALSVSACVPRGAPALAARLCDPWGLDFQQQGGV
jgi:hypothetical protein